MKLPDSVRPQNLKPGDAIGICAPARKISRAEVEPAVQRLEKEGFFPVLGEHLFSEENQFSGSDLERTSDLQRFLDNSEIKAVIFARGGYGTMRIIDQLDFRSFTKNPKWLIGYSDITVLHSHVQSCFGIETLHATMPINFGKDAYSTETLFKVLSGHNMNYTAANHSAAANREGKAEGQLVGGNLSLLYALQGSVSDLSTDGKILFIEDLDEYLYHLDRMMLSLKRAGKLSKLKGLVVGGMNDMKDNTVLFGKTAEEIISGHVQEFDYPVCFGFPAGHDIKNYALPLGRNTFIDVKKEEAKLEF